MDWLQAGWQLEGGFDGLQPPLRLVAVPPPLPGCVQRLHSACEDDRRAF
jgi:hypothetical protein